MKKICSKRKLCNNDKCEECYEKSFASHEKSKYWGVKNEKKPRDVFKSSHEKYWFNCDKCSHLFCTILSSVTSKNSTWCPYCSNKILCNNDNCKECFKKSFASHEKNNYWSVKNEKNPRYVFKRTNKKYWFNCDKCSHQFEASLAQVTLKNNPTWCSYCSNKILCNDNCKKCHNKSFASHEKSKYWSEQNEICPRDVFKHSGDKYWFYCNKCSHQFYTVLSDITKKNPTWCPYCSKRKLCNENCNECFKKSFASHEKSKYWGKQNKNQPKDVFKSSYKKYWFNCDRYNHQFEVSLNNVTSKNPSWCPYCKHKTELKLLKFLKKYNVRYQPTFDWCINKETGCYLPFDFLLVDYNIIIELDGRQHFEQISNWSDPQFTQKRDIYKMNKAIENNYTLIRILQEDVLYNRNGWESALDPCIKLYETPEILFLVEGAEYDCFEDFVSFES